MRITSLPTSTVQCAHDRREVLSWLEEHDFDPDTANEDTLYAESLDGTVWLLEFRDDRLVAAPDELLFGLHTAS